MAGDDEGNAEAIFKRYLLEGYPERPEEDPDDPEVSMAYQVARQLVLIAEQLEEKERQRLAVIVDQLSEQSSNPYRQIGAFVIILQQFVRLLERSVNFPVSLIKSSIATFYLMWNNPRVAAAVIHNVTGRDVDQATVVPEEITRIDAVQMYLNALKHGREEVRHIRLMIIGQYSVGKTHLVYNLLGKEKSNIQSTDGIDVHINECKVIDDCEWTVNPLCFGETNFKEKLASVMNKTNEETDGPIPKTWDPDVVIYERCPASDSVAQDHKSKEEELDKVREILDKFVKGGDPLLADYTKQVFEAVEMGSMPGTGGATSLSVWDFAGQYIYYSTHHFFMNTRSIYLLVMDVSRPLDAIVEEATEIAPVGSFKKGYTCLDAFKFWLNSIHTYSRLDKNSKPCVILVGTHKDKIPGTAEEKRQNAETYFNHALEAFIDSPILKHVHPVKFLINNHSPEEDVKNLKVEIIKLAKSHSDWQETVPAGWIQLERNIQVMKMEGKEIVTLQEITEADGQNEVPMNSQQELKLFLKFQHALGNLLYFDKETLESLIILSPQWIIDAFKCFVTQFPNKKPEDLPLWKDYEKMAILRPRLVDEIFAEHVCLVDYKEEIIKYMEELDIMAKPSVYEHGDDDERERTRKVELDADVTTLKTIADETKSKSIVGESSSDVNDETIDLDTDGTDVKIAVNEINENACTEEEVNKTEENKESDSLRSKVNSKQLDFHVVPCMLSVRPPVDAMQNLIKPQNAKSTPTLCFVFQGNFLPPAVFHRLLAVCISTWSVSTSERKFLLYNGLAVFDLTHTMTLTLWFQDHVIFAKIGQFSMQEKSIPAMKCKEVREVLESALVSILGIYRREKFLHDLPFEEYVHCGSDGDHMLGMMKVSQLIENGELKCSDHAPSHMVGAQQALGLWFPDSFNVPRNRLNDIPTEKELANLSQYIGKEYWHVAAQLDTLQPAREQMELDHPKNTKQVIFNVMNKWKLAHGKDATLAILKDALETAGTDPEYFHKVFLS